MAQHHRLAQFEGLVAQDKVVGAVVGRHLEAAHPPDGLAAEGHRRPQHKLHPLHQARRQHSGGHLHAHAHGLKPRPQPAFSRHATIRAAHPAHSWVRERQRDRTQIVGCHAHIAVADDENLVRRLDLHPLHRGHFGVDVVGFAAGREELDRNLRVPRRNAPCRRQPWVVRRAGAEENLVFGVVLVEEGGQVRLKPRLIPMQRLKQGQRRGKARTGLKLRQRRPPLPQIAGHGPKHHAGKDRGGHQPEDAQCKKNVQHAGTSITGAGRVQR